MNGYRASVVWQNGSVLKPGWKKSLDGLILDAARRHADLPILVDQQRSWSWLQLLARAGGLAADWHMLQTGERVVISAGNSAEHWIAELAAWMRGAIVVPLSPELPATGLKDILEACQPRIIVCEPSLPAPPSFPCLITDTDSIRNGTSGEWRCASSMQPDDPALILYTSGSSGRPKGVVLSHRNICSQQAAFAQLWPEVGPGDRLAAYLPWHHSFGSLAERLWAFCRGACLHLVPGGGHDHQALCDTIRSVRPSIFMSVPKLHHLVASADILDAAHVRWVFSAGAALGSQAEAAYAAADIPIIEGWGLTEAGPSATITPLGQRQGNGCVGLPIPGVRLGIARDGAVLIHGPGIMAGYWQDPQATAEVIQEVEGLRVLDSGDCGSWTEKGLCLHGRRDQQLKHPNGEKLPVHTIERDLQTLPGVQAAILDIDEDTQALAALLIVSEEDRPEQIAERVHRYNQGRHPRWQRIARLACYRGPVQESNGMMTSNHKLRCQSILQQWRQWRKNLCAQTASYHEYDLRAAQPLSLSSA